MQRLTALLSALLVLGCGGITEPRLDLTGEWLGTFVNDGETQIR